MLSSAFCLSEMYMLPFNSNKFLKCNLHVEIYSQSKANIIILITGSGRAGQARTRTVHYEPSYSSDLRIAWIQERANSTSQ